MIICNLHRSKLDANREIKEAAFGNEAAENAWRLYHQKIKDARNAIKGNGIVLDMHGQSHKEGWIELGYLIYSKYLDRLDNGMSKKSSIKTLTQRAGDMMPPVSFIELISGNASLGGYLQKEEYSVVPSPSNLSPNGGGYYSGGYITRAYGSLSGGAIDAIQIESPRTLRGRYNGPDYAKHLASAIYEFTKLYYP